MAFMVPSDSLSRIIINFIMKVYTLLNTPSEITVAHFWEYQTIPFKNYLMFIISQSSYSLREQILVNMKEKLFSSLSSGWPLKGVWTKNKLARKSVLCNLRRKLKYEYTLTKRRKP